MAFVFADGFPYVQIPILRNGVASLIDVSGKHQFLRALASPKYRRFWGPASDAGKRNVGTCAHHFVLWEVREDWTSCD